MIYAILGLCFFIVPIWAYNKGFERGLAIKQDKPIPSLIKSPIKAIKEHKEEKELTEKEKEKQQEFEEWFSYGGD